MTLRDVRQALAEIELYPSKALGQNFLIDANILRIIVEQADLRADDVVLEIGPGLGVLTRELLARAAHVVAIEKDRRLCGYLRQQLPALELIEGDALVELEAASARAARRHKVIANLPYSISSQILEQLVEGEPKPRRLVLLLQREVAERLAAGPRTKDYGALSLYTQLPYHVTLAHLVASKCFFPAPHVESAITVLDRRDPRVKLHNDAPFHALVRQGFSQRRKMLRKLLAGHGQVEAALEAAGASVTARAEELDLEQWITVANALTAT